MKQIERRKDPEEVAYVRAIPRDARGQKGASSDKEIHKRPSGVDPTIGSQR